MRRILIGMIVASMMAVALPAYGAGSTLVADLAAANEVGGGDGDGSGLAQVMFRQTRFESQVCFRISTSGLTTDPVAAHIHEGEAGVNGPVVIDLDWADNGSGDSAAGCVTADEDLARDIRQNPGNYYVNVHNPTVPSGAVRGQLTK